jgi:hypothetical protein
MIVSLKMSTQVTLSLARDLNFNPDAHDSAESKAEPQARRPRLRALTR